MEKVIHRVWLGPDRMPDAYSSYGAQWAEMNPDWVLVDWTQDTLWATFGQMPCPEIWDRLGTEAKAPVPMRHDVAVATQRADLLGYYLIWALGGVYLNCDLEPLRPLSKLPLGDPSRDAWACYEDKMFLNNGAMGGPKGHPFFKYVLDRLPAYYQVRLGQPMNYTTGPRLLTDCFADWGIRPEFTKAPVVGLPRHLFHYASYTAVPVGGDASKFRVRAIKEGAIALHHWGHKYQMAQT